MWWISSPAIVVSISRNYNVSLLLISPFIYNTIFYENPHLRIIYDKHLMCTQCSSRLWVRARVCRWGNASQNIQPTLIKLCLWLWVGDNKSTFLLRGGSDGVVMIASGSFPFFHCAFIYYNIFSFDLLTGLF